MTSKTKTLKQTASLDELCDWGRTVEKTTTLRECLYPNNCELQINNKKVEIWSTKDIQPEGELFMDYGEQYWN